MLHLVPRGKKNNMGGPAPGTGLASGTGLSSDLTKPSALVLPLTPGFTIHSVCAFEKHEVVGDGKTPLHTLELYTTAWESSAVSSGKVKGGLLGSWEGEGCSDDTPRQHILMTCPINT